MLAWATSKFSDKKRALGIVVNKGGKVWFFSLKKDAKGNYILFDCLHTYGSCLTVKIVRTGEIIS